MIPRLFISRIYFISHRKQGYAYILLYFIHAITIHLHINHIIHKDLVCLLLAYYIIVHAILIILHILFLIIYYLLGNTPRHAFLFLLHFIFIILFYYTTISLLSTHTAITLLNKFNGNS